MILPGGAVITGDGVVLFVIENGAVIKRDPAVGYRLYVEASFRLPFEGADVLIEPLSGFTLTLGGHEEEGPLSRPAPWNVSFDNNRNAIFRFSLNDIRFIAIDSVFPVFRDEHNGVILFKKSIIEFPDGTRIEAPLNTTARITDNEHFEITIGIHDARQTNPDGTVTILPGGTVLRP
jgi:hypothetical protein